MYGKYWIHSMVLNAIVLKRMIQSWVFETKYKSVSSNYLEMNRKFILEIIVKKEIVGVYMKKNIIPIW